MAIIFPNIPQITETYASGLDWTLDNFGKRVILYYHPYLVNVSGSSVGPGNMGDNILSNGSTSFFPNNNFLADSTGITLQQRDTGIIKLLCTYNPKNVTEKTKIEEGINIQFKKEGTYIYTKGYMADYLNVINADYAVFPIPSSTIDPMRFRLISHPRDKNSLVQGRYFNCWWEQIA